MEAAEKVRRFNCGALRRWYEKHGHWSGVGGEKLWPALDIDWQRNLMALFGNFAVDPKKVAEPRTIRK